MDDEVVADVPPFVPARMVNEFVFCPRFFHLAWSSGEVGENDLTADGKWVHRRVDTPTGRFDVGASEGRRPATSVTMSSERLGVIAKMDIVRTEDGAAVPIELKRGRPRDPDHPVWEPERVQLAVQGMVLRDNGLRVEYGEVQFAESREVIQVDFTDHLVDRVESILAALRGVAASPVPPAPFVDSPKCPTCIMNGACLPDEHNLIRERTSRPPRRLVPTESASAPLYVTEAGARVGLDGGELTIKKGADLLRKMRLIDVSQVCVYGNVQLSAQATREVLQRDIPICWFSGGGWFFGVATGLPSKNVELRRRQMLANDEEQLAIARRMVAGKMLNARTLLRRNTRDRDDGALRELKRLAVLSERAESPSRLLGLEGGAARIYFAHFASMIRQDLGQEFDFAKRTRRPPTDAVNCLLSYLYSLLVKECTTTILAVGLDPYTGLYHRPRFGRPALALDLAEEFRPLVADSCLLTLVNNGEIAERDFHRRGGAVSLTPDGRRAVLKAFERRMAAEIVHPTFNYRVSYRRAIEVQARLVGAVLLGELDLYRAMVTR